MRLVVELFFCTLCSLGLVLRCLGLCASVASAPVAPLLPLAAADAAEEHVPELGAGRRGKHRSLAHLAVDASTL